MSKKWVRSYNGVVGVGWCEKERKGWVEFTESELEE
jgi:hypothetical protein